MSLPILVVDDEPDIGALLSEILEDEGFAVSVAMNAEEARKLRREQRFEMILLDIWMPDTDGITLLKEWQESGLTNIPVIMMSGHATVETAVEATRLGAYDFIEKPIALSKLLITIQRGFEMVNLQRENTGLKHGSEHHELVGHSQIISGLRQQAQRLMQHDTALLISGESGSGRSLFADYLHSHSQRRDRPFIPVRMAGMDAKEQVRVLFGNPLEKVQGRLQQAHGGTLFIKDIADMDKTVQARLLGSLETDELLRDSEQQTPPVDVRVIAATAYDLEHILSTAKLREDLFYYLNVVSLHIPPLREHCEDIPELLDYYVNYFVSEENLAYRRFSMAAQNRLRHYHWPGNVRELKNLIQRLLILGNSDDVGIDEIEPALNLPQQNNANQSQLPIYDLPLREAREQFERGYLEHQLKVASGNVSKVAALVGLERTHLYRKLRALDIDPKQIKHTA